VDEVKLWNKEIPVTQIARLKDQWLTSTGIDNIYLIERLYPNPAKDIIHIEFPGTIQIKNISLFNMEGREVSGYKVNIQSSGIEIEISQTKPGLYLLRMILKDGQVITRKIIIM
jgi:2-keto-4-pentenoate hydratase